MKRYEVISIDGVNDPLQPRHDWTTSKTRNYIHVPNSYGYKDVRNEIAIQFEYLYDYSFQIVSIEISQDYKEVIIYDEDHIPLYVLILI